MINNSPKCLYNCGLECHYDKKGASCGWGEIKTECPNFSYDFDFLDSGGTYSDWPRPPSKRLELILTTQVI